MLNSSVRTSVLGQSGLKFKNWIQMETVDSSGTDTTSLCTHDGTTIILIIMELAQDILLPLAKKSKQPSLQ